MLGNYSCLLVAYGFLTIIRDFRILRPILNRKASMDFPKKVSLKVLNKADIIASLIYHQ